MNFMQERMSKIMQDAMNLSDDRFSVLLKVARALQAQSEKSIYHNHPVLRKESVRLLPDDSIDCHPFD